ncbi:hypothetical protein R5H30_19030 [Sulfitobacter sp. D35]|uniref:hypothetical protein n=1 Tax=Sulfitobacter sp. D35 TaxID=3083252 RepID=UPI00296FEC18|nr:hypothetical protein [Sulfitobacter sp. D35]MDW4500088.1 hypothetical protein [Sulfitobacter sp. D35]
MRQFMAILNVVAWSGFWAFGYLALSADVSERGQVVTATILAALGAALGLFAYLRLVKYSEQSGYAKRPNRAEPTFEET